MREYARDQAQTNGTESFWALLKRGCEGAYRWMSGKHLDRYLTEFESRYNARPADTITQMSALAANMSGKRLRYQDLIA